jgi:hypothetical protein
MRLGRTGRSDLGPDQPILGSASDAKKMEEAICSDVTNAM